MDQEPNASHEQRVDEVIAAYLQAMDAGQAPDPNEWLARHPDLAADLRSFLADQDQAARLAQPLAHPAEAPTLAPQATAAPPVGAMLRYFGDYELLEEIARGGMGVVFKARQVSLDRVVAVKMILAGQLAGEQDVQRFYTEARAAANLQHPNIVAIHEVGQHEGQHYFSMDFVEGRSLADLVRDHPLSPHDAARYVQTIAEAIHYAHQQGTLHRDLKPSNVLIDPFDQPRVTDFGLAKRTEGDANLTATGAILGTPSYMPPEQASSDRGQLGPASDVYSLGAVLYELVTGRPPFRAATPMDTILQVLSSEPAAPRLLNPSISRDLETIILKCLAKEPRKRYATAQDLAEDLAAFLEGRPIKARRPGLLERSVRWVRQHRGNLRASAVAALVAVALVVGVWIAWNQYYESRLGSIQFGSNGPPLVARVTPEDEDTVLAQFTVPTQEPIALPAGSYRLDLATPNRLSESFHFQIQRGDKPEQLSIDLKDRLLWDPLPMPRVFDLVHLAEPTERGERTPTRHDIVTVTQRGLARIDGGTGESVWDVSLDGRDQPALGRWGSLDWMTVLAPGGELVLRNGQMEINHYLREPTRVIQPAPDLDGDGTADLVWLSRHSPSLLAVSGIDGRVFWWHPLLVDPAGVPFNLERRTVQFPDRRPPGGRVIGEPAVLSRGGALPLPDRDDLVVLVATLEARQTRGVVLKEDGVAGEKSINLKDGRWIEAVAGRSGRSLWHYPAGNVKHAARVHPVAGRPAVLFLDGERLVGLDAATGQPLWQPIDLGVLGTPYFLDLTADGQPELLLLTGKELHAVTLPTGKTLWKKQVQILYSNFDHPESELDLPPEWPLLIGQETDPAARLRHHAPLIVIPHDTEAPSLPDQRTQDGVALIDGMTGEIRWTSPPLSTPQYEALGLARRLIVGPDLDGDDVPEVFRALILKVTPMGRFAKYYLQVDALSGSAGRVLWTWRRLLPTNSFYRPAHLHPMHWLSAGPDGWPLLVVPFWQPAQATARSRTYLLSAGSGRLIHDVPELASWRPPCDLDGDGSPDLVGLRYPETRSKFDWFRLHAQRIFSPDAWHCLGRWQPAQDLDGDGMKDVCVFGMTGTTAVSGRDGRRLWRSEELATGLVDAGPEERGRSHRGLSPTLPLGDLDGDGLPDLLIFRSAGGLLNTSGNGWAPLLAASGKTGKVLWGSHDLGRLPPDLPSYCNWLACQDLDRDGTPEVLLAYELTGNQTSLHLAALSGRTGKRRWQQVVVGPGAPGDINHLRSDRVHPGLGDLNGDGTLDLVVPIPARVEVEAMVPAGGGAFRKDKVHEGGYALQARDGRDGSLLWQCSVRASFFLPKDQPIVAVGDLDGDGPAEVLVCNGRELQCLNGRDGQPRWTKPSDKFEPGGTQADAISCPVFLRARNGGVGLVITRSDALGPGIFAFDGQGNLRHRRELDPARAEARALLEPWVQDLRGDGQDALLVSSRGKLLALGPNATEPVWSSPPLGVSSTVYGFLPGQDGKPGNVVVRSWQDRYSRDNASGVIRSEEILFGIDADTGEIRWRCGGPGEVAGILGSTHPQELPRVVFTVNGQYTACRLAQPTDAAGELLPATGVRYSYPLPPDVEIEPRPLSWARDNEPQHPILFGLALIFLALLVRLAIQRSWRTLGILLVLYATLCILFVVLAFVRDSRSEPLMSWERYTWTGWYMVGVYIAALLGLIATPPTLALQAGLFLYRRLSRARSE